MFSFSGESCTLRGKGQRVLTDAPSGYLSKRLTLETMVRKMAANNPPPSSNNNPQKTESLNKMSSVQSTLDAAIENGFFGSGDDAQRAEARKKAEECQSKINSAWKNYNAQKYDEALNDAQDVDLTLSEVFQGRTLGWRLSNLYAVQLFAVLAIWFFVLVWVGYSVYQVNLHSYVLTFSTLSLNIPKILRLVILTGIAGGLGAVLRQVYYVAYEVKGRNFRRSESVDIVMSPFIGFLFGFFAFLVIAAGLLVATQKATGSSDILDVAAGFLLGFNWKAAHDYILSVTSSLLGGSTSTTSSTQKPAQVTSPSS